MSILGGAGYPNPQDLPPYPLEGLQYPWKDCFPWKHYPTVWKDYPSWNIYPTPWRTTPMEGLPPGRTTPWKDNPLEGPPPGRTTPMIGLPPGRTTFYPWRAMGYSRQEGGMHPTKMILVILLKWFLSVRFYSILLPYSNIGPNKTKLVFFQKKKSEFCTGNCC